MGDCTIDDWVRGDCTIDDWGGKGDIIEARGDWTMETLFILFLITPGLEVLSGVALAELEVLFTTDVQGLLIGPLV